MLTIAIVVLVAVIALIAIFIRSGSDDERLADPHARRWRRLSLIVMAAYGAFMLFMGVGEMVGGDLSGFIHLIPVALIGALMFLAAKRPFETGIVLLIIGGLMSAFFFMAIAGDLSERLLAVAVGGLPWLVSGILLLAPELGRRSGPHDQVELGA